MQSYFYTPVPPERFLRILSIVEFVTTSSSSCISMPIQKGVKEGRFATTVWSNNDNQLYRLREIVNQQIGKSFEILHMDGFNSHPILTFPNTSFGSNSSRKTASKFDSWGAV